MKKILFAVSAVALALSAGSAFASDLPSRKEAPIYIPPPPPPLWTGFYGGLNIGGGWDNGGGSTGYSAYYDPKFAIGSSPSYWQRGHWQPGQGWQPGHRVTDPANLFFVPNGNSLGTAGGVVGGAQVGYNYQFGQFVIGVETDFQGTSISGGGNNASQSLITSPYYNTRVGGSQFLAPIGALTRANTSLEWFGTVRGRVGYLFIPTLLIYGTGGFAYGQVDAFGFSNTATGWTAGGGAEWLFAPNWSAKIEYLYVSLSNNNWNGDGGFNFGSNYNPQFNVVRAGVNYHFNWDAPAPVVAKY
jgi:outer membrane immunogenic protein